MNRFYVVKSSLSVFLLLIFMAACSNEQDSVSQEVESKAIQVTDRSSDPSLVKRDALEIMTIKNGRFTQSWDINGRVIAGNTTQLFAEVQGKIIPGRLAFKAGNNFSKGDLLINIDQKEFALNLEAQRSAFLNALTGIMPDMKADYPDNYPVWQAYIESYDFGNALQPLPEAASSEIKYFLTSNQIYTLFYQIKSLEERLNKYQIFAPYTGMITQSAIDIGSLVSPGQPLGTISNRINYELEAGIPLRIANNLKIGDQLTFVSNEIPGSWIGRVVRVNNLVDPSTQNIPVYFRMNGKNLRAGMYLEGKVQTFNRTSVALIPSNILGRDESVLLLKGDIIERKAVQPVEFIGDSVLVKGLSSEDQVILNQFDIPMEGVKVSF